jgi:flagellar protein FliO/FliZ
MGSGSVGTLLLRLTVSMVVVLGLMAALAALMRRGGIGRGGRRGSASIEIIGRAQVGKRASVVIVRTAQRGLVLGVTDTTVSVLAETGPDDVFDQLPEAPGTVAPVGGSPSPPPPGTTMLDALRERTVRRS